MSQYNPEFESALKHARATWPAGPSALGMQFAEQCRRRSRSVVEGRAAAGLVSVSTTCRGMPSALAWSENVVTIDPAAARVTRLRKGLGIAAKQLHNQGDRSQQIWMQTLTYKGDNRNWRPEHISRYLDALRKWHYAVTGSKTVRYAWVAELQQRGVIHYHVIVWLAGGLTPPKGDRPWRSTDRQGLVVWHPPMWPHGMSRRDRSTAPVAYLMKYASKVESKNVGSFPHGARIHGAGGMDASGRAIRRWVLWPAYVQGNASVDDRFRPAPGGGFINDAMGPARPLLAEYAPTGGGFTSFIRVRTTPRSIDAVGPFSWAPSFTDSTDAGPVGYLH